MLCRNSRKKFILLCNSSVDSLYCARFLSSSSALRSYEDTRKNLKIGKDTRVIYQGFTGRVATTNAQQSLAYGTKIVGGTTPGKNGEHLGLPLLPTVREAAEQLKPDATAVFVAAQYAAAAIEDAIAAEIPLIVAVAEFIPLHDVLRICAVLKTQSKSRFMGANAPGIIAPLGNCRIGFQPLPCYMPGHIGLVAKSGTLSYETVGSLTRAGLGQSLCIGMGGDIVAGTNFVDALEVFEKDDDTEGIIIAGEVGGRAEQDAAEWIKEYRKRVSNPKPIAAVVGGIQAKPGRIMGHAGAFVSLGEESSSVKYKALEDAGVTMVRHPSSFGNVMKQLLSQARKGVGNIQKSAAAAASQNRSFHTIRRVQPIRPNVPNVISLPTNTAHQKRTLYIEDSQAKKMLKDRGIPVSETSDQPHDSQFLGITVDRTNRCPAIIVSPTTKPDQIWRRSRTFPYSYTSGPDRATIQSALSHLQLDAAPPQARSGASNLITTLSSIFKTNEAYALSTHITTTSPSATLHVTSATFSFDDSAFKSSGRQPSIHALPPSSPTDADEAEAAAHGIVYIKYADPSASIGTLINGAGLAMNAVDALADYGAKPTNFLDTGGKATSATVKKCFELLLRDPHVKVVFVNIFGGLTLCDMIAEGVVLAFKELEMKIPVVVRLRGTNEEEGQRMIAKSGLPLHAFDDFERAARKCIELANQSP